MYERLPSRGRPELDAGFGVVLRELGPQDAQRYFDLIDYDREHFSSVHEPTADKYQTVQDVAESFSRTDGKVRYGMWVDGVMVGSINYQTADGTSAEVGYWVGKEYEGHHYARQAVRTLVAQLFADGWRWVEAWARVDNVASRRTLTGAALKEVGFSSIDPEEIHYELQNPKYA